MAARRSFISQIVRSGVFAVALVLVTVSACGGDAETGGSQTMVAKDQADFYYHIALGTGGRIDAGESVQIMEPLLRASVGETIRIDNDDDRGHSVGPFFVAAGERFVHRFASPGTYIGECTVSSEAQIEIIVT